MTSTPPVRSIGFTPGLFGLQAPWRWHYYQAWVGVAASTSLPPSRTRPRGRSRQTQFGGGKGCPSMTRERPKGPPPSGRWLSMVGTNSRASGDVATVEVARLPDPHPGHREQPDQGGVGGPSQRGPQRRGGRDYGGDVGFGIQVRAGFSGTPRESGLTPILRRSSSRPQGDPAAR